MRLVLPYPPSANRYWRVFRGHAVKSKEAKDFGHEVARRCIAAGLRLGSPAFPTGFVSVRVEVYRPRKIGDLDNSLKCLLDSLRGLVFTDDAQVVRIEADRFDDKARPRVEVVVEALNAAGVL